MKASDVKNILNNLIEENGDIDILAISIIRKDIHIIYGNDDNTVTEYGCNYKNCDEE